MKSWGSCPCGGVYEDEAVEISVGGEETSIVVAQGTCSRCGASVLSADTFWHLEAAMRGLSLVLSP